MLHCIPHLNEAVSFGVPRKSVFGQFLVGSKFRQAAVCDKRVLFGEHTKMSTMPAFLPLGWRLYIYISIRNVAMIADVQIVSREETMTARAELSFDGPNQ
jgi:hypothetical protein